MARQIADMAGRAAGKKRYEGGTTLYVTFTAVVSASMIMAVGYDTGISGGVTAMNSFLQEFFPTIYRERKNKDNYCRYNNQLLQLFTSSLYLAAIFGCMCASHTTRVWGRRPTILVGGVLFLMGTCLNAAAQNVAMLILGRLLQGSAIGLGLQATPLYMAEMAPAHTRGALMASIEIWFTIGLFVAGLVNYRASRISDWGWRLSLGLAGVPGMIWTLGGILLPDSPTSMLQRGHPDEARRLLERIRGTADVEVEFRDIEEAVDKALAAKHLFRTLLQARYRPQMTLVLFMPFFFQFTGTNAVNFYAPIFFRSLGFTADASLYSTVIVGGAKVLTSVVAIPIVDRWGRKILLYEGGVQMFISLITIGALLQHNLDLIDPLPREASIGVVVVICIYVVAFTWSWGALGFVIPSEIFPLEVRPAAMSMYVSLYYVCGFVIAQSFLSMLCGMRYGVFYFFAFWVAAMTCFVAAFLPETKKVGLERMTQLWDQHWFWKRVVSTSSDAQPSTAQDHL
ncbi:hypothetical protein Mapa_014589 [Marchantia paleacea]|nr:hypothetical protein Mapa_014589 [Marchantia paleacea]